MKTLANVILFIFLTVLTLIGLALNKFYHKYIVNNIMTKFIVEFVLFLAILRVGLIFIVPLIQSILSYFNIHLAGLAHLITIPTIHELLYSPLVIITFAVATLVFLIRRLAR